MNQPKTSLELADAHLEEARHLLANVNVDRQNLVGTILILLQKMGGEAVITKGELEALPDGMTISRVDETDLGFRLIAVAPPVNNRQ